MIDPAYYTPGMAIGRRKDRARTPGLWLATSRTLARGFVERGTEDDQRGGPVLGALHECSRIAGTSA
jgi:hypothetical protein